MDPLGSSHRRFIRVVVPVSRTLYFNDGPVQPGIACDAVREFEKMLAARASPGIAAPTVVIFPTVRDRLLPALHAGHAEIAIGGFTVTEAHSQAVAFSHATLADVHHVVVAGRDEPPIASLDDLSGREVHVRRSSGYFEDLTRLNERLRLARRAPVTIVDVDEALEQQPLPANVESDRQYSSRA